MGGQLSVSAKCQAEADALKACEKGQSPIKTAIFEEGKKFASKAAVASRAGAIEATELQIKELESKIESAAGPEKETLKNQLLIARAGLASLKTYNGGSSGSITGGYEITALHYGGRGGASGRKFYGGDELDVATVRNYADSLNSFAKQALISDLVAAAKDMGFAVSGDSFDEKLASLKEAIPNSRNKKKFSEAAASQERVCRAMAEAINKHVGDIVIDAKASPEVVCQSLAEVVHSLSAGMRVEFLAVSENLRTVLGNLKVLREQSDRVFVPLLTSSSSSDPTLQAKEAKFKGLYKILTTEMDRQLLLLQNLLEVTLNPAESHLQQLIKEMPEVAGLIEPLGVRPGDPQFSSVIAKVLSGTAITAEFAMVIDKALKTVGLTIEEYVQSPTRRELDRRVGEELLKREFSDEKMYEFLRSVDLLMKNYSRAQDIAKVLKSGSSEMKIDLYDVYGGDDEVCGGDEYERTPLDKRVAMKGEVRNLIFKTFSRSVDEHMKVILASLDSLSSAISSDIEHTDELRGFADALTALKPLLASKNAYLALLGYYADAASKERRETFLGRLSLVASYADALAENQMYSRMSGQFRDVSSSIKGMKASIDSFAEKAAAKFGRGEEEMLAEEEDVVPGPTDVMGAGDCSVVGGASFLDTYREQKSTDWELPKGEDVVRTVPRKLAEIITKFNYYLQVSAIKRNMSKTSGELDHYAEKYENIRAAAIAKKIDAIKAETKTLLETLGDNGKTDNMAEFVKFIPVESLEAAQIKDKLRAATIIATKKHAAVRINFWRTVEAVDEYMRVFTNGIAKSKGALDSIKSMLDDTEVIYDWFDDETGDEIARVFDSMPSKQHVAKATFDKSNYEVEKVNDAWITHSDHYYTALKNAAVGLPGSPMFASLADDDEVGFSGFKAMKKVTRKLALLKNILSVFVHIGSKYCDCSKIFMTPTQVYKNLQEWMEVCSFGIGASDSQVSSDPDAKAFMKSAGIRMRSIGDKSCEDDMFAMIIKSMCAKVLTVVGLYDVFERPEEVAVFSPIRFMLGGANDVPTVESAATELYVRLPLLAEFYRDLFKKTEAVDNNERTSRKEKFALLPEMEGAFGGLIRLVFIKAKEQSITTYSDIELCELISEVNKIYASYSSAANPTQAAIDDFIREVNMRWGLMAESEIKKYDKDFAYRQAYSSAYDNSDRSLDAPLLPGEEEMDFQRDAKAPSMKFEKADGSLPGYDAKKSPYFIQDQHKQLVQAFRCMLDKYFRTAYDEPAVTKAADTAGFVDPAIGKALKHSQASLRPAIKMARMKLAIEQSPAARYKAIASMIRGGQLLGKADHMKYVMLHESVVTGLNTLSAVCTLLTKFHRTVLVTDLEKIKGTTAVDILALEKELSKKYFDKDTVFTGMLANMGVTDFPKLKAGTDCERLAEYLIDAVFSLGMDLQGLVGVRVSDGKIIMNFSELKDKCIRMLDIIKVYIELLRPHISEDCMKPYVEKKELGSVYWLQEQLVEKLFDGREGTEGVRAYVTLDQLNPILNKTLEALKKDTACDWVKVLKRLAWFGDDSVIRGEPDQSRNSGWAAAGVSGKDTPAVGIDFSHPMNKLLLKNEGAKQIVYPDYSNRFLQLYSWDQNTWSNNSSLLFAFNQLLAKYLQLCYDTSAEKIYVNSIAGLVNSPAGSAIADLKQAYPDHVAGGTKIEVRPVKAGSVDKIALYYLNVIEKTTPVAGDGSQSYYAKILIEASKIYPGKQPDFMRKLELGLRSDYDTPDKFRAAAPALFDQFHTNENGMYISRDSTLAGDMPVPIQSTSTSEHKTDTVFPRTAPTATQFIFATLALIVRNMMNSKNTSSQTPIYLLDNINEVSMFKKEAMRAHLPTFKVMFVELSARCEFLKKVSDMVSKTDIVDVASSISQACGAVVSSIDHLQRELADTPRYLETHAGSIAEYKAMHQTSPLMPLSTALYVLADATTSTEYAAGVPISQLGSAEFKLAYGTRGLFDLTRKVTPDSMPGWTSMVELYNMMVPSREQIGAKESGEFLDLTTTLLRYVRETRLKGRLTPVLGEDAANINLQDGSNGNHGGSIARCSFVAGTPDINLGNAQLESVLKTKAVFAIKEAKATQLVDLTSNADLERSIELLAKKICGEGDKPSLDFTIANILDLNVMPINIHAMMRDIPLANLYNYSYTFDRLAVELFYGVDSDIADAIAAKLCTSGDMGKMGVGVGDDNGFIRSGKDLFVALLMQPYSLKMSEGKNWELFSDICRGDTNLPLGRPKFLGDQLFNKALFGSMYVNTEYNRRGPTTKPTDLDTKAALIYPADKPSNKKARDQASQAVPLALAHSISEDATNVTPIGRARADTILARNLILLTNTYRTLLLRLRGDLMYSRGVIVSSNAVTREDNTELQGDRFHEPRSSRQITL